MSRSEVSQTVEDWGKVPSFKSFKDEAEFWKAHQIDNALLQLACFKADSPESVSITLRMDPRMLARLKRLSRKRYISYQSMMKQWLAERLEKEMDS